MSETPLRPPAEEGVRPFVLEWWMPLAVFATAWLIRLYRLAYITNFIDDRYLNVPSAFNFTERGLLGPDNWWTQPAKHVLLYWNIHLYGNDAVGWRMREVLFGSLAVLLVFLIARQLFRQPFPAFAAAALYALDPLQIAFSRASSEDVPAVFFMLAGFLLWLKAIESDRFSDWLVAGALMGIALALRIHVLLVLAVMVGVSFWLGRKKGSSHLAGLVAHLLIVPIGMYLLWWLPYFLAGNTLGDLWSLHIDTYLVQTAGIFPNFDPAILRLAGARRWFTGWVGAGNAISAASDAREVTVMTNNPAIWFLFIPSMIVLARDAWHRRDAGLTAVIASFLALYLLFAVVPRDVMVYSALAVIPFGFLALGLALSKMPQRASFAVLAALVAWSGYLLPLMMATNLAGSPYRWLLSRLGM